MKSIRRLTIFTLEISDTETRNRVGGIIIFQTGGGKSVLAIGIRGRGIIPDRAEATLFFVFGYLLLRLLQLRYQSSD
jgi:hypothetical protein